MRAQTALAMVVVAVVFGLLALRSLHTNAAAPPPRPRILAHPRPEHSHRASTAANATASARGGDGGGTGGSLQAPAETAFGPIAFDSPHPLLSAARWAPLTPETNLVLFVVGGEGTGHHAVLPILHALLQGSGMGLQYKAEADVHIRQQMLRRSDVRGDGPSALFHSLSLPVNSARCHAAFEAAGLGAPAVAPNPGERRGAARTGGGDASAGRQQDGVDRETIFAGLRLCAVAENGDAKKPSIRDKDNAKQVWSEGRARKWATKGHHQGIYDMLGQMEEALQWLHPGPRPTQLRVLVLSRNFTYQIMSHGQGVWERHFGEFPDFHAAVTVWFDRLISHDMGSGVLHPSVYRVGHYDRLLGSCAAWVEELARFLALPEPPTPGLVAGLCKGVAVHSKTIPRAARERSDRLLAAARAAGDWRTYSDEEQSLVALQDP